MNSFRWKKDPQVDAYVNSAGEVFLFVMKKSDPPAWEKQTEQLELEFANEFPALKLIGVGGARKTENASEPLTPTAGTPERFIALGAEAQDPGLFWIETHRVLNPGLFLDQVHHRAKLTQEVHADQKVLNLFSYTGAFSIAAAKRGAKTVNVDVSKRYLRWCKENFELNQIPLEGHLFIAEDARKYVKRAIRRGLHFDFVILDPPTFSRSEEGVFQVNPDGFELFNDCLDLIKPERSGGGKVYFSTNDERISQKEFEQFCYKVSHLKGAAHENFSPPAVSESLKSLWVYLR